VFAVKCDDPTMLIATLQQTELVGKPSICHGNCVALTLPLPHTATPLTLSLSHTAIVSLSLPHTAITTPSH